MGSVLSKKEVDRVLEALSRPERDKDYLITEHPGICEGISDEDLLEEEEQSEDSLTSICQMKDMVNEKIERLRSALEFCEEDQAEALLPLICQLEGKMNEAIESFQEALKNCKGNQGGENIVNQQ